LRFTARLPCVGAHVSAAQVLEMRFQTSGSPRARCFAVAPRVFGHDFAWAVRREAKDSEGCDRGSKRVGKAAGWGRGTRNDAWGAGGRRSAAPASRGDGQAGRRG
jgi:hypothetical protein